MAVGPRHAGEVGEYHGKYGIYSVNRRKNQERYVDEVIVSFDGHHAAAEIYTHYPDPFKDALDKAVVLLEKRLKKVEQKNMMSPGAIVPIAFNDISLHRVMVSGERQAITNAQTEAECRHRQAVLEMEMFRHQPKVTITGNSLLHHITELPTKKLTVRERLQAETDERLKGVLK